MNQNPSPRWYQQQQQIKSLIIWLKLQDIFHEQRNWSKLIKTGELLDQWSLKHLPKKGSLKTPVFRWWMWSSIRSQKPSWSSTFVVDHGVFYLMSGGSRPSIHDLNLLLKLASAKARKTSCFFSSKNSCSAGSPPRQYARASQVVLYSKRSAVRS